MSDFTLFDFMDNDPKKPHLGNKLDVVQMEFVSALPMTWVELFSGYSKIKAIKLYDLFAEEEVVFEWLSVKH